MKTLTPHNGAAGIRPVLTIVMDGVGLAPATEANAVSLARTPNLDRMAEEGMRFTQGRVHLCR